MKKTAIYGLALLLASATAASSATVLYDFSSTAATNPGNTITGAALASGAGITPTINGLGRVPLSQTTTTIADAVTANDYFQFAITTTGTDPVNFTEFKYDTRANTTTAGVNYIQEVRVSLDNFATAPTFVGTITTPANNAPTVTPTYSLSTIPALQGLASGTTATFRLYMADNQDSAVQQLFDNVSITAAAVPEPSSLALLGLSSFALALRRRRK